MSEIDISREAVEQLALLHLKEGDNFSSLTAITLHTLRAALDAQGGGTSGMEPLGSEFEAVWDANLDVLHEYDGPIQSGVTVKPLVWAETEKDFHQADVDPWLFEVGQDSDGWWWQEDNLGGVGIGGFATEGDAKCAAYTNLKEMVGAMISTPTPLVEVAMRERAAKVALNTQIDYETVIAACGEESSMALLASLASSSAKVAADILSDIRTIPTTFTHAELLAAAEMVPEVKALVDAATKLTVWAEELRASGDAGFWDWPDLDAGYTDTVAALAPFTRKGE